MDYKDNAAVNIEKIENELEELNLPPQRMPDPVATPKNAARFIHYWPDKQPSSVMIVTRHDGLCDWLVGCGIIARRIEHATVEDVHGKIVLGSLSPALAAEAQININIDLTSIPEMWEHELTAADVDKANPTATAYYTMSLGDGRCRNPHSNLRWPRNARIVRQIIDKINSRSAV